MLIGVRMHNIQSGLLWQLLCKTDFLYAVTAVEQIIILIVYNEVWLLVKRRDRQQPRGKLRLAATSSPDNGNTLFVCGQSKFGGQLSRPVFRRYIFQECSLIHADKSF